MADSTGDGSRARWKAAECPFVIEYDAIAIDDIRLAVTDAFFSLPRGGAEIGGILLGEHAPGKLTVTGYVQLDCEHAYGPGFTLSPNDHSQLAALISSTSGHGKDVVGWYHSHTRSEINLTDADLEVYKRYFPEPWQVALVMKPSAFQPARCGFFFRQPDGAIRSDAAFDEFELAPLAVRPAPRQGPPEQPPARSERRRAKEKEPEPEPAAPRRRALTVDAVLLRGAEPASPAAVHPAPEPVLQPRAPEIPAPVPPDASPEPENPVPALAAVASSGRVSSWYWIVVAALVGVLVYQTRDYWMTPKPAGTEANANALTAGSAPAAPRTPLSLTVSDAAGQLEARWDGGSPLVANAAKGTIEIEDGERKAAIPLNQERLRTGNFTYARESQGVSIRLTVEDERGRRVQDAASFFGKLPEHPAPPPESEAVKQRDQLLEEMARLRTALTTQTERANRLERSLEETRRQMKRDQQRRRLENQIRDPLQ
jgi:hypothetical protein